MKLKPIIKMLLPIVVGAILTVAVIVFVLLQLSAASYLVLLVCTNVIVLWIWIKSNRDRVENDKYYDYHEFRDRLEEAEDTISDIKQNLKIEGEERHAKELVKVRQMCRYFGDGDELPATYGHCWVKNGECCDQSCNGLDEDGAPCLFTQKLNEQ